MTVIPMFNDLFNGIILINYNIRSERTQLIKDRQNSKTALDF